MKRAKKLIWLLVTAAVFAAAPLTAMALPSGGYVPTSGTYYLQNNTTKKWEKQKKLSYTYKKDGKITKYTPESVGGVFKFTWKGNYMTKYPDIGHYSSDLWTYKYKNKKLVSYKSPWWGAKTVKIKWKGKKGTVTQNTYTTEYTINGKGQLIKMANIDNGQCSSTYTYQYYGNGNLKSSKAEFDGLTRIKNYNKKGYQTSTLYYFDGSYEKVTYTYKTKKGKITEVVRNRPNPYGSPIVEKVVFKKWKKVSHVRNCDAWGRGVPLALNDYDL